MNRKKKVVVIGAGPAGLTSGIEFLKTNHFEVTVLERDNVVGGLSKTYDYKGYKFDIGPHHFLTSDAKIEKWWKDLMGEDFIEHNRFTRIYYKKRYFNYPLNGLNVIKNLDLSVCIACVFSYIKARLFPIKEIKTFEDWITNQFGCRLYSIFFKTYTEKLWGISCKKISSDWASQRIKGFSMSKAIFYAFLGRWFKKNAPRTLSDEFYYPPNGAGQLWEKVATNLRKYEKGKIDLNQKVVSLEHKDGKIVSILTGDQSLHVSKLKNHAADYFLSAMPLKALVCALDPLPPSKVTKAANALIYRGLVTVNLIVNKKDISPDHWIYVHDKDVKMIRIDNMSNFSDKMVADSNHSAIILEYFCNVGDSLWNVPEEDFLELGKQELEKIGIVKAEAVLDGMVVKTPEAYPVYDEDYKEHLAVVLDYLKQFSNLKLIGRNGLHRYNNMDLAMLSAMDAVEKVVASEGLSCGMSERDRPLDQVDV